LATQSGLASPAAGGTTRSALLLPVALALVAIAIAWTLARPPATSPAQPVIAPPIAGGISASSLESDYGLRVSLIGVTAAGGMIDVRLKAVDAEKANRLLRDSAAPALMVPDGTGIITIRGDVSTKDANLETGSTAFLLFPNSRGVVKPGTPVTLVLGQVTVEAIPAR
jgi:hypothetical protein